MASSTPAKAQEAKVTLYWLNKSRAQRIVWLLEEAKIDFNIEVFHRQPNLLAPPEMKEIHPMGKAPIVKIEVPNMEPTVLAESGAITEYITDHFAPQLAPKRYRDGCEGQLGGETESWRRFKYFLHYAEGSLMPFLLVALITRNIRNAPVPFFLKFITNGIASKLEGLYKPELDKQFKFLENQLETSPDNGEYLCGKELTGADILMSFPLIAARDRAGLTEEDYPKLSPYIDRLLATDGYKRAVQKIVDIEGTSEGVAF